MKNNYLFFLVVPALVLFSCKETNRAIPVLKFDKDTFHFETIQKGDSVNALFHYQNTGEADLLIKKIGPGCGCTNAYSTKKELRPLEEAELYATYHSDNDTGLVTKTIIVETNAKPILKVIYIRGRVK